VDALKEAIALAETLGDLGEVQTCTSNLAAAVGDLGRVAEALRLAERAYQLRDRLGDLSSVPSAALDNQLAQFLLASGQFGRALTHFNAAAECFRAARHAPWLAVVENHLAVTWLALGQPGRAQQALGALGPGVLPSTRGRRLIVESRISAALGRGSRAALLQEAIDPLATSDAYLHLLAQLERSRDMPAPEAAELCIDLLARAEAIEYLGIALKVRLVRAEHLVHAGDVAAALEIVRTVGSFSDGVEPRDIYLPEALWIVFSVLDAAGDRAAAEEVLRRAVNWIRKTALPNVSQALRDSFLDRNPINRSVLTTASRYFKHHLDPHA
jgi:tetratricopeptide (TPR) repeat protein